MNKQPPGPMLDENWEIPKARIGVTVDDFVAYMPNHSYIYVPTREMWPVSSVNARCTSPSSNHSAAAWLDHNQPVEQMTWSPGESMLIADRHVSDGGWIEKQGVTTFNLYRPPLPMNGDPGQAGKWIAHIDRLYGIEAAHHIIKYFAFKVQQPDQKINHALLLGGGQGIGKDTICEPLKYAVGPWNFAEISPKIICGRFNGYVKSVILRVNEARDLGDLNRFELYEHLKPLTASPPDVVRVDEKHLREYAVFNVCGVIITTNYKTNGIYLPAEDRRHYVAWSDSTKEDFTQGYWDEIWGWYQNEGGLGHVVAYLQQLDIADFNPKAPPPKTEAFWAIVHANQPPENAELADALDELGKTWVNGAQVIELPKALTIDRLAARAPPEIVVWLRDHKNRRAIPHRLENLGYEAIRNPDANDGLWRINNKRQVIYARRELSTADKIAAAGQLAKGGP